jgi:GNAT superfamily N-acetyltransferase
MTDVLGVCESWGDGVATVRREQGDLVTIATADIVSGRTVPRRPSPYRRLGAEQADRLALPGWPATETEPLGDWQLRASGGFSSRANSVLALGDPGVALEEAVGRVARWYAARGLDPRAHVHPSSPAAGAFAAAGWTSYDATVLMLGSVAAVLRRTGGAPEGVVHATTLDAGWLATDERASRYGHAARRVMEQHGTEAGDVVLATVGDDTGAVVARGRGAVHGDWVGVSSLWTAPARRRAGLGTAVLASLVEWGSERGATTAYLQVVERNEAALALYESRGFEPHHTYAYVTTPRSEVPAQRPPRRGRGGGAHRTVTPRL